MMGESWEEGAEIDVGHGVTAVCLDGSIWELRGELDRVLLTLNPPAAVTCKEVRNHLQKAIEKNQSGTFGEEYNQSGVSD